MGLEFVIGICAFVILGVMMGMLHMSSKMDEDDPITQEIITRATGSTRTQEKRH